MLAYDNGIGDDSGYGGSAVRGVALHALRWGFTPDNQPRGSMRLTLAATATATSRQHTARHGDATQRAKRHEGHNKPLCFSTRLCA